MPEHRFEPLARTALLDITPEAAIGGLVATRDEGEGVISLQFESLLSGYPGWRWTVSVAQIDDADPTIVETELTPGEGALLAPDWVPWSERLAEYKAAQEAAEAAAAADDAEGAVDDEESDDDLDDDLLGSDVLHGGDLDGVDIDEADLDDEDDDDEDDEDDDLDDEDDAER
ncbi:MAG TPA: DUF3027 domain-containing protein [Rhodoglobus sp.]|nr:DUF3027 domain-containing protein [Rhodoglobus sp.]